MHSCGPPHISNQKQDDQLEHKYSSNVTILDVTLKTCQTRWMIGRRGERGSGISVLATRNDDDDDDYDNDQLKLSLKYFLFNAVFSSSFFLVAMYLLVVSSYSKRKKSHSSIICLVVIFRKALDLFIKLRIPNLLHACSLQYLHPYFSPYLFFATILDVGFFTIIR